MRTGARAEGSVASLALLFALGVFTPNAIAQEHSGTVLPGCGIAYPGGYDVNTAGFVEGTLRDLQLPPDGPVRLIVTGERERWVVLASPRWFWKLTALRLAPGDLVTVSGSKTLGADGTLYLVASEVRSVASGDAAVLRDRRGAPLWKEGRAGRMSGGGAFGTGEGMGRGHNGGRGRR